VAQAAHARVEKGKALWRPRADSLRASELATERAPRTRNPSAGPGTTPSLTARPSFSFGNLPLQAKLTVGRSDDPLEFEADQVAERVMRVPTPPGEVIQRKCAHCEEEEKLRRVATSDHGGETTAPDIVHDALRSHGKPLDGATRKFMERRFGHDFGQVRVHTDALASQSAESVGARAYTVGPNIAFRQGEYVPSTTQGRRLLAHELTHVVQQSAAAPSVTASGSAGDGGATEQKQGTPGAPIHSHPAIAIRRSIAPKLQRYPVPGALKCPDLVNWLNTSSPYAPEWAQTDCQYEFNGELQVSPPRSSTGNVTLTAKGHPRLTVAVTCNTDLPEWSPTGPEGGTKQLLAWQRMITQLSAHERRHKAIGEQWRVTTQRRFRTYNATVSGTDQDDAMSKLTDKVAADQAKWQLDAQAAQKAIDPFTGAILTCPPETGAGGD